jgi:hypothetical protein
MSAYRIKSVDEQLCVCIECCACAVCTFAFFYLIPGTATEKCFALSGRFSDIPDKIETHACVFHSPSRSLQKVSSHSDSSML